MPETGPWREECIELTDIRTPLVCHLPRGHEGPHWDADDDIVWSKGEHGD